MDIYLQVTDTGLVPMYDSDLDNKKRLKVGSKVLASIKMPRNYEFHKKFFALLRLTIDNLPDLIRSQLSISSEEDLLECLKLELGLFETRYHGGKEVIRLNSISFAKMDETEFETFFNRSVDIILSLFLRGVNKQSILEEIEKFK